MKGLYYSFILFCFSDWSQHTTSERIGSTGMSARGTVRSWYEVTYTDRARLASGRIRGTAQKIFLYIWNEFLIAGEHYCLLLFNSIWNKLSFCYWIKIQSCPWSPKHIGREEWRTEEIDSEGWANRSLLLLWAHTNSSSNNYSTVRDLSTTSILEGLFDVFLKVTMNR